MKPRPIRNCAVVVANPKALLLYLATTHALCQCNIYCNM